MVYFRFSFSFQSVLPTETAIANWVRRYRQCATGRLSNHSHSLDLRREAEIFWTFSSFAYPTNKGSLSLFQGLFQLRGHFPLPRLSSPQFLIAACCDLSITLLIDKTSLPWNLSHIHDWKMRNGCFQRPKDRRWRDFPSSHQGSQIQLLPYLQGFETNTQHIWLFYKIYNSIYVKNNSKFAANKSLSIQENVCYCWEEGRWELSLFCLFKYNIWLFYIVYDFN